MPTQLSEAADARVRPESSAAAVGEQARSGLSRRLYDEGGREEVGPDVLLESIERPQPMSQALISSTLG